MHHTVSRLALLSASSGLMGSQIRGFGQRPDGTGETGVMGLTQWKRIITSAAPAQLRGVTSSHERARSTDGAFVPHKTQDCKQPRHHARSVIYF